LAIIGYGHIKFLYKKFKKELVISLVVTVLFTIFGLIAQNAWEFLSSTITSIEYFLLDLLFNITFFSVFKYENLLVLIINSNSWLVW
jgi:chromate transport protein ChrA